MTTTTELIQDADTLIESAMFTFGLGRITEEEYYDQLEHAKELIDAVQYVDEHHGVYKVARRHYDSIMVADAPIPPAAEAQTPSDREIDRRQEMELEEQLSEGDREWEAAYWENEAENEEN
ncbi:MAG: hypothetical protein KAJ19_22670 [Gammaproteobacteria bacterium]|nr:hypothetical protein [Gammaproteobacteria bacterium]